ncbi:bifunctional (p)ppGpp synthetase/guanosine-3',5'-bis(diphosphate) 3'-pyrophosphohydrolase [Oleiagrimonas sp.]|jgi:GTP pyrophosphokinase|uniref:RelA/SpoT family protein n=1 Tax=Oleiagrimonas sp. TaxID=2010330 RepID=UPI0026395945|nr:bifunctional (p)ppGpp synthetase/guanosine-3',5'-bis(diphosphate) 3'-pyrophosphohydrolase [Oleiagrimonas sp.]MDA3914681.1 bifunctional (p)ppGpp synthetase/guanosine-3',5'-bis(diphosphate) 3'-pyrophosphohydrolase [Oleiagrimonas sp.]
MAAPDSNATPQSESVSDTEASTLLARARAACEGLGAARSNECDRMLELLQQLRCDEETRASACWFALSVDDAEAWDKVRASLPETVTRLVDGQHAAERVWALHAQRVGSGPSEGLRRLLLAIIRDVRVVFILLARQLLRMRGAARLPAEEASNLARLTADIHAPLANRLGIWQLKWELEDLSLRFLQPQTYQRIAKLLDERREDREHFIGACIDQLGHAMEDAGIHANLAGRPKHIHSIWKKMQRKHLDFDELYDIRALRVLVDSVSDCYAALGVVHGLWPHIPKEFDDYIARPKDNGYRSLHTAVLGPGGRTLEVQIRTHDMHRDNELGVAAHWRYKEGGSGDAQFERRVAWMRSLLEHNGEDEAALMADFETALDEDRVYVLTPRGEVIDMPRGATVLDFAYHIHTDVGHRCRGAKVNGRIVPLGFQPRSGDRIEILTGKTSEPSRDWLSPHTGYLHSGRARDKVRAWFRRKEHGANLVAGRQVLERELKRLAVSDMDPEKLAQRMGFQQAEEMLVALALGELSTAQVARVLTEGEVSAPPPTALPRAPARNDPGAMRVEGVGDLMTSLARCCQPLPGDPVRGYITKGRGVSVHRADCASLARLARRDPKRVIEVEWGGAPERAFEVSIKILGYDRKGLQKDITGLISNAGTPIVASSSRLHSATGEAEMDFTLRVRDYAQLSVIMARLEALPNVVEVRRLAAG